MAMTNLDELLLSQWDRVVFFEPGVMRTRIDDTIRRRVPGTLGLVVQFNPSHLKSKRPVDPLLAKPSTDETSTKPKAMGFNFTLAKKEEFLCGLRFGTGDEHHLSLVQAIDMRDARKEEPEHFVLVNVAPLVRGHMLFVLELNRVKPQTMTKKFMQYALSISQAIQRECFALGFNSAGAWSSVNHFHLQGYFFPHIESRVSANFPVATQDSASGGAHVVEIAWTLLELLQSQSIPHNILIVGMTVFIFPRHAQCENGVGLFPDSASESDTSATFAGRLRIAVAELAGLVIAGDSVVYDNLTEDMFNTILQKEVSLNASEEAALMATWKEKLNISMK
ncbi:unnamed protein product [Peronospora belbahrii]|uniref:GDP-D-glucose phosphorylase 1 n=1 Tax=Peronospora belbahrii TaxID=622444 RepID=A0ABN8D4H0_9STRA|nr:unnamed protein product [Peronospora belbahrii]